MRIMSRQRQVSSWAFGFLFFVVIFFKTKQILIGEKTISTIGDDRKSFVENLFFERLKTHSAMYDEKKTVCKDQRELTDDLKLKFSRLAELLKKIRSEIPEFPKNYFSGRGIVLTGGGGQLSFIKTNLQMIQLTSTKLPIEIWFSSSQISRDEMKNLFQLVPKLDLRLCSFDESQCESRRGVFKLNSSKIYKPKSNDGLSKIFPFKPAAILSSTFAEVLFLDCDAYVTRDVEFWFSSDPMYQKFGALFYPDAYKTRQHPEIWKVLNSSCAEDEYELDSATILVNKLKVWKGLYATKLINDHHQTFYQFVTDGDKDTFRLGFRLMKVNYYLVMIPCATGTFHQNRFCGHTLCKTDSLAQHVYVNHVHLFKYEPISYSKQSLAFTRIGLGDPNKNPFVFLHCRLAAGQLSCFHILNTEKGQRPVNECYPGKIPSDEIENHQYLHNESLFNRNSRQNRAFLTETNNLMPSFVENLLRFVK